MLQFYGFIEDQAGVSLKHPQFQILIFRKLLLLIINSIGIFFKISAINCQVFRKWFWSSFITVAPPLCFIWPYRNNSRCVMFRHFSARDLDWLSTIHLLERSLCPKIIWDSLHDRIQWEYLAPRISLVLECLRLIFSLHIVNYLISKCSLIVNFNSVL